ncbi:timm8a [Bugula neritina]|uniref:Mitochondrial import inner membrane translocase subunit n=1 Tax=Bugula neritina TaxID=10212 RepID=A0A7J7KQN9_BUGNE|nr:timm8a [Bugula neritina]
MNDPQIQRFVVQTKQRAEFQTLVNSITNDCWDKCITYTISSLDSKQERCITNCVQRFIDTSKMLTQRLSEAGSKSAQKSPQGFGSKLYN